MQNHPIFFFLDTKIAKLQINVFIKIVQSHLIFSRECHQQKNAVYAKK